MKEKIRSIAPLIVLLAILAAILVPQKLEQRACEQFGEPLFAHSLPENAVLVQKDAAKDEEGGTTAALLLQTDMTSEELLAFYSDTLYPPAEEGQTVTLEAKALDESSLEALKQAKLWEEGASYQFVYLYSR